MPLFSFILSLFILQCLLCNCATAQKAGDSVKPSTSLYISLEEEATNVSINISNVEGGISLEANNATFEEILQGFADRQKIRLKLYCDDPSLDRNRISMTLKSPSLRELFKQLLKPRYKISFLNQEGKPAKEDEPVKEVGIYSEDCEKKEQPVRTFVILEEHPILNKNPKEITLQELSQILKEEGPSSRIMALKILGVKDEKDRIPLIKDALKDGNPQVVLNALKSLKLLGIKHNVKDATGIIFERIQETPYPEFLMALAQLDKERIWPVIDRFINMPDRRGQNVAARALVSTKDIKAIGYLSKIALSDDMENLRLAIWAIGKIDGHEGAEALIKYLGEESGPRQIFAAQAVKFLSETERVKAQGEIEKIVKSPDASDEMLFALAQVSYLEPLKNLLSDKNVAAGVKRKALKALVVNGTEEAVDIAGISIDDSVPDVRLEAVNSMAEIATENTIPYLVRATADKQPEIRKAAVKGLAGFSSIEPVLSALSMTLADENEGVRRAAIDTFLQLGEPNDEMVSILKNASAKSTDPYVSEKALYILKLWGKDK